MYLINQKKSKVVRIKNVEPLILSREVKLCDIWVGTERKSGAVNLELKSLTMPNGRNYFELPYLYGIVKIKRNKYLFGPIIVKEGL